MEGQISPEHFGKVRQEDTSSQETERKSVEINGRKWSYLEYGNPEGQPILMLHGWMASPKGDIPLLRAFAGDVPGSHGLKALSERNSTTALTLRQNVEALKGKYRIVDPYQPGTQETKPLKKITYDAMADEMVAFQRELNIKNAIVFGSSAGGIIGTKLAARDPEAVKALIIQGTPTEKEDIEEGNRNKLKLMTFGPIPYILYSLGIPYKIFKKNAEDSEEFRWSDKESQEAILEAFRTGDPKTTIKLGRKMITEKIDEDIRKVKCPVIVIDGVNAELVPIDRSIKAAVKFHPEISQPSEKIRQGKLVILPIGGGAGKQGHPIVNNFPEGLAVAIDDMLGKMLPKQKSSY